LSEYKINDKRTKLEIDKLINFCKDLVIKDEELADELETIDSSKKGYALVSAILKTDKITDYVITQKDLDSVELNSGLIFNNKYVTLSFSKYNPQFIPEELQEFVLDYKRYKLYREYMAIGDLNPYYEGLYQDYEKAYERVYQTYEEFINSERKCFYVIARRAADYSILSYPDKIFSVDELSEYRNIYYECQNYFTTVLYNEAYKIGNKKYNNFARLLIVFMSMQRFMNARIENITNIDFYDNYSIRNMFISYGLDYFSDMPQTYQRRILKNINDLLATKGTTKAIVSVLQLFGYQNINVFKYILAKDYKRDEFDKPILSEPDLKFLKIPHDTNRIEKEILNATSYSYDSFIADDPLWQVSDRDKQDLINNSFNYVETKYIGINSTMNLLKQTLDLSYFYSLILDIEKTHDDSFNLLSYYNIDISKSKIGVVETVIALQSLVLRRMGYKDNILTGLNSTAYVNGCNYDEILEKVKFRETSISHGMNESDEAMEHYKYLSPEFINRYKGQTLSSIVQDGTMTKDKLVEIYLNNQSMREDMEKQILEAEDYHTYKKLLKLYEVNFVTNIRDEIFMKEDGTYYETYRDFVKSRSEDLYDFINIEVDGDITSTENTMKFEDLILTLCNSLDVFLNDDNMDFFLTNNILSVNYIKTFMYRLINVIKSYTIDIKELSVVYVLDSKFLSAIHYFDETTFKVEFKQTELVNLSHIQEYHNNNSYGDRLFEEFEYKLVSKTFLSLFEGIPFEDLKVITNESKFSEFLEAFEDQINVNNVQSLGEALLMFNLFDEIGIITKTMFIDGLTKLFDKKEIMSQHRIVEFMEYFLDKFYVTETSQRYGEIFVPKEHNVLYMEMVNDENLNLNELMDFIHIIIRKDSLKILEYVLGNKNIFSFKGSINLSYQTLYYMLNIVNNLNLELEHKVITKALTFDADLVNFNDELNTLNKEVYLGSKLDMRENFTITITDN